MRGLAVLASVVLIGCGDNQSEPPDEPVISTAARRCLDHAATIGDDRAPIALGSEHHDFAVPEDESFLLASLSDDLNELPRVHVVEPDGTDTVLFEDEVSETVNLSSDGSALLIGHKNLVPSNSSTFPELAFGGETPREWTTPVRQTGLDDNLTVFTVPRDGATRILIPSVNDRTLTELVPDGDNAWAPGTVSSFDTILPPGVSGNLDSFTLSGDDLLVFRLIAGEDSGIHLAFRDVDDTFRYAGPVRLFPALEASRISAPHLTSGCTALWYLNGEIIRFPPRP